MGRFHRQDDGSTHVHDEHPHEPTDGVAGSGEQSGHRHEAHGDHSAYRTGVERVQVLERVFGENDAAAEANRAAFDAAGVRCVNVMSSPGAGKTALIARTLAHLRDTGTRVGVVGGVTVGATARLLAPGG